MHTDTSATHIASIYGVSRMSQLHYLGRLWESRSRIVEKQWKPILPNSNRGKEYGPFSSAWHILPPRRWKQHVPPKYWCPSKRPYGVAVSKTTIWTLFILVLQPRRWTIYSSETSVSRRTTWYCNPEEHALHYLLYISSHKYGSGMRLWGHGLQILWICICTSGKLASKYVFAINNVNLFPQFVAP